MLKNVHFVAANEIYIYEGSSHNLNGKEFNTDYSANTCKTFTYGDLGTGGWWYDKCATVALTTRKPAWWRIKANEIRMMIR